MKATASAGLPDGEAANVVVAIRANRVARRERRIMSAALLGNSAVSAALTKHAAGRRLDKVLVAPTGVNTSVEKRC